jgi:hypothetical protein
MPMRAFHIFAVACMLPVAALAEVICALGAGASAYNPASDDRPSADTMQIVRRMDKAYESTCLPRCPQIAMFRNPTAANLMLVATKDDAKLVYSPQFFSGVYGKFGESGLFALIAHVYGHAIDETTQSTWIPTSWNPELRADAWTGCAVAKGSLPSSGIASALGALAASPPPSQSNWSPRLSAVRLGFTHCGGQATTFDSASKGTKTGTKAK